MRPILIKRDVVPIEELLTPPQSTTSNTTPQAPTAAFAPSATPATGKP